MPWICTLDWLGDGYRELHCHINRTGYGQDELDLIVLFSFLFLSVIPKFKLELLWFLIFKSYKSFIHQPMIQKSCSSKDSLVCCMCSDQRYWKQGVKLLNKPVQVGIHGSSTDECCSTVIEASFDPSSGELVIEHDFRELWFNKSVHYLFYF